VCTSETSHGLRAMPARTPGVRPPCRAPRAASGRSERPHGCVLELLQALAVEPGQYLDECAHRSLVSCRRFAGSSKTGALTGGPRSFSASFAAAGGWTTVVTGVQADEQRKQQIGAEPEARVANARSSGVFTRRSPERRARRSREPSPLLLRAPARDSPKVAQFDDLRRSPPACSTKNLVTIS
jgi:hypothetical protein